MTFEIYSITDNKVGTCEADLSATIAAVQELANYVHAPMQIYRDGEYVQVVEPTEYVE